MNDFNDIKKWEILSRDSIDVKTIYIDMADGDLKAGILLSQIVYWHLPDKKGNPSKLRVKKDGKFWIAKSRTEWWDEIRLKEKAFDRAKQILEDQGLIESFVTNFNGRPVPHIRIVEEGFMARFNECYESTLPKRENRLSQSGRDDFPETGETITENTTENTSEIAASHELGPRSQSWLAGEIERDFQEDLEFEEGIEYIDADPYAEESAIVPKWRKPENYNWQHEGVLVAAMDATRLRNFQTKKEWSAWRKFDKSMVSLTVLMTTQNKYPVEWIMHCIEWARKKNLSARTASGSFSTVIRFKSLISLIENEAKKDEFVEKWIKDHEEKEVQEQFKDSDDGLSDNPFADR